MTKTVLVTYSGYTDSLGYFPVEFTREEEWPISMSADDVQTAIEDGDDYNLPEGKIPYLSNGVIVTEKK